MEFSSEYFTETLLSYFFAFCYLHLLFCSKINILHLLKMVKI